MYAIKTESQFLDDLKKLDERLKNLKIASIEVARSEHKVTYEFICDKTVDEDLKEKILQEAEKITSPVFFTVVVNVRKIVSNDELVARDIYKYLKENFISLSIFLKQSDISCDVYGDMVKYVLRLSSDGVEYAKKNGLIAKINAHLFHRFCSDFVGEIEEKEADETVNLLFDNVYEEELEKIEHRTIKVEDEVVIDDPEMGRVAEYIEDLTSGDAVVCGKVVEITEKQTKTGKPFFILKINDTTGTLSGLYFSKKSTYKKICDITEGECIIARGTMGEYNGRPSFTFSKINRCTFPTDFVKKDRYKKSAPKSYRNIFPEPASTIKIKSVFDLDTALPEELLENDYVVFDTETTGLDYNKDCVTEIGAVKIKKGKICEQFTSLINPDKKIPENIVELTGINDDMVKDSPRISAVIPDFMKFIEGCVLVGHNVEFDMSFMRRFALENDYEIKNRTIDTISLAKKYLKGVKKYDLHTVADAFNVTFRHHRALSDAYATAEVFIELIKLKNTEENQR